MLDHAAAIARTGLVLLATTAVHGTVLALLAYGLGRALRLRPATLAALWLVVVAKLALPWAPALPWSVADLLATLRGGHAGPALVLEPATRATTTGASAIGPAILTLLVAALWCAGAALVLVRAARIELGVRRSLRAASPAPAAAIAVLHAVAARLGIARVPALVLGPASAGPHVVGLVRATIVIPPELATEPALLRAALAHELGHVRRHDAAARLVQLAAHALLWWCPTVYLASRRLELAREQACDAFALHAGDLSRPDYARLLVRMAHLAPTPAPALAAPRTLDARVTAILDARAVRAGGAPGPGTATARRVITRLAILATLPAALGGARPAAARAHADVCVYSPALAEALIEAYPDADRDGDGTVTRDEACDFQTEYRRRLADAPGPGPAATVGPDSTTASGPDHLLDEPLCCNCDDTLGRSAPPTSSTETRCYRDEGD